VRQRTRHFPQKFERNLARTIVLYGDARTFFAPGGNNSFARNGRSKMGISKGLLRSMIDGEFRNATANT